MGGRAAVVLDGDVLGTQSNAQGRKHLSSRGMAFADDQLVHPGEIVGLKLTLFPSGKRMKLVGQTCARIWLSIKPNMSVCIRAFVMLIDVFLESMKPVAGIAQTLRRRMSANMSNARFPTAARRAARP
jgi:hypothetical protein